MRARQKPIVVVGSINLDLVAITARIPAAGETVLGREFQMHPGGKGANQAVAVARLGHPVLDLGTNSTESVDYPDYAETRSRRSTRRPTASSDQPSAAMRAPRNPASTSTR